MAAQASWVSELPIVNHNASFKIKTEAKIEDSPSAKVALHSDELHGRRLPLHYR